MNLLVRIIRYINHESVWWPLVCLAILGVVIWRRHDPQSLAILLGGSSVLFIAPFFFRHTLIRNYPQVVKGLNAVAIAMIVAIVGLRMVGRGDIGELAFALSSAFTIGVLFWCASDPMFEMMHWLAFPTEHGRLPDEIYLVDQRRIPWPDEPQPVECCLFKFRYDNEWNYGITGPITFSLFEQDFQGKSPDEIYAAYAEWYGQEDIGKLIQEQLDGED